MINDEQNKPATDNNDQPVPATRSKQEQSDPEMTELRGFTDPKEDLEPTLTDGTKAPDKAESENAENQNNGKS